MRSNTIFTHSVFTPTDRRRPKRIMHRINKPAKRGFILPIGIEYTYHAKNYFDLQTIARKVKDDLLKPSRNTKWDTWKWIADKKRNKKRRGYGFNVYDDCGPCVEITSPVHKSMRSLKNFYTEATQAARKYKMKPHSLTRGSGGAHINVSIPHKKDLSFTYAFLHNLMVDLGNRPYLNWIFNDWSDNHTANCMWASSPFRKLYDYNMQSEVPIDTQRTPESIFLHPGKPKHVKNLGDPVSYGVDNKQYGMRCNRFSFELRIFDMFRDKKDLVDVLDFVEAYLEYINFVTHFGLLKRDERFEFVSVKINLMMSMTRIKDLSFFASSAETEFNQLLGDIGLDQTRYSRFCRRNLDERIKNGKDYLT